jgi:7,8-dihydroneopterin aldolase/epimerase/oxygenase
VTDPLTIEVRGLSVHAHHGVHDDEREHGQRFLLDLVLVPSSTLGCETDRLGDTVSYGDAARIAADVADTLLARLPLERATITVHKPEAPLGREFEDVAVTVSRVRVASLRS